MQLLSMYLLIETFHQKVNSRLSHLSHVITSFDTSSGHKEWRTPSPQASPRMPLHIFASFYPLEKQQSHRQESEACHTPKNSEMTHEFFSDLSNPCLKCQVRKTSKHVFGMVTLNGNSSSFNIAAIIRMLVIISCPSVWTSLPGFFGATLREMISSARL